MAGFSVCINLVGNSDMYRCAGFRRAAGYRCGGGCAGGHSCDRCRTDQSHCGGGLFLQRAACDAGFLWQKYFPLVRGSVGRHLALSLGIFPGWTKRTKVSIRHAGTPHGRTAVISRWHKYPVSKAISGMRSTKSTSRLIEMVRTCWGFT